MGGSLSAVCGGTVPAAAIFAFLGVLMGMVRGGQSEYLLSPDAAASAALAVGGDMTIVAQKSSNAAMLLRAGDAAPVRIFTTGDGPHEVAVSPDGGHAVVTNYGGPRPGSSLTLIDLWTDQPSRTIELGTYYRPHGVVVSRDGASAFVTVEANRALIEVDLLRGEVVNAWEHGQHGGHMVVLDDEERFAYIANVGGGSVSRIDLTRATPTVTMHTDAGAEGLALQGGVLWVTNTRGHSVSMVDAAEMRLIRTVRVAGTPIRVLASPAGDRMFVTCVQRGRIAVLDAATGETVGEIDAAETGSTIRSLDDAIRGPGPIGMSLNASRDLLLVSNMLSGEILTIDPVSLEILERRPIGGHPDGIAAAPGRKPMAGPVFSI